MPVVGEVRSQPFIIGWHYAMILRRSGRKYFPELKSISQACSLHEQRREYMYIYRVHVHFVACLLALLFCPGNAFFGRGMVGQFCPHT